ncbi:MAG: hypothetical protein L0G63_07115 [Psychrobacter sp.]|uniref:hypothetical protein n=1 Tax=Psychrobacter sp. TaxID=56811 RepID=UPI00264A1CDF|nr:hypothetical protein [Psychrobacter sp.]MDN5620239.1 hypothetical protein [Psychrobacter sp.]
MPSALDHNDFIATDINNENLDTDSQRIKLYARLKEREQCWWQSRQQLIEHQEQKVFWYGENSLIMWLLWQLVGYVVVATALMLLNNMMNISLTLWQYIALFILQTLFFVSIFAAKGRLANKLQNDIDKDYLQGEQALNEMIVLAEDSLYPDVHAKSPISLKQLNDYLNGEFHLSSLHRLLQKEVDAGRLMLGQTSLELGILPLELADVELIEHADKIIYKSTL